MSETHYCSCCICVVNVRLKTKNLSMQSVTVQLRNSTKKGKINLIMSLSYLLECFWLYCQVAFLEFLSISLDGSNA